VLNSQGVHDISGKWELQVTTCSPPLISTSALNYIQKEEKEELASFYNTTELIKVLCDATKQFSIVPSRHAVYSALG